MKAAFICIIIALIAIVTTTATIANVQFELDQLLSQQQQSYQPSPISIDDRLTNNGTLAIKAHRYSPKLASYQRFPLTFSIINIPANETKSKFEVFIQGAKIDACDMVSRTFDQTGAEIGYDYAARLSTPSYTRFSEFGRFTQPGVEQYSYEINLLCWAASDGFPTNFVKATATVGSFTTPLTYLEEFQPWGQLSVKLDEMAAPAGPFRFYSIEFQVENITSSIFANTTIHFGEMLQNMQVVQTGSSPRPHCLLSDGNNAYEISPILSPYGQLHQGHALSFAVPVTIPQGRTISFSCYGDYAFISDLHPNYRTQMWSVTTDYPLTRIQAQVFDIKPF